MHLPKNLRSLVTRVSRHEAGHFVIAKALGFRTGDVSIKLLDSRGGHVGSSGIILAASLSTTVEVSEYLRSRTKVLYSGVLSEAMIDGVIRNDDAVKFARSGGAVDYAKARELVHLIKNIEHGAPANDEEDQVQLSELDIDLWNAAAQLVVQERECIEAVGSRLASKVQSINQEYCLRDDELRSIPELMKRFATTKPDGTLSGADEAQPSVAV